MFPCSVIVQPLPLYVQRRAFNQCCRPRISDGSGFQNFKISCIGCRFSEQQSTIKQTLYAEGTLYQRHYVASTSTKIYPRKKHLQNLTQLVGHMGHEIHSLKPLRCALGMGTSESCCKKDVAPVASREFKEIIHAAPVMEAVPWHSIAFPEHSGTFCIFLIGSWPQR